MTTTSEALAVAIEHHQAGRLHAAEEIYRQILSVDPNSADAWHLLGMLAHRVGQLQVCVDCISHAIRLRDHEWSFHNNLAIALKDQGQPEAAIARFQRALELNPEFAESHYNLGTVYGSQGNLEAAEACYRRALELNPDFAAAHNNLGNLLSEQGKHEAAIPHYQRALALKPDYCDAYNNLGNAFKLLEKYDEAIACYQEAAKGMPMAFEVYNNWGAALGSQGKLDAAIDRYQYALQLKPDYAEAHYNLANTFSEQGKIDAAIACFRRAIELKPDYYEAHNNLGNALKTKGDLDEAIACFEQVLKLNPAFPEAHNNLGSVLKGRGQVDAGIAFDRQALELKPDYVEAHSNLLFSMWHSPSYDAAAILAEHRRWNQMHAKSLIDGSAPHANLRDPERRLRVGYVSPDFSTHPVGRFILPLLEAHDRRQFEIYCYASVAIPDIITDGCRENSDHWREALGWSNERVAAQIREDEIDILVDLSVHTAKNRMLVFARKPAPVQVAYLGTVGTTGLDAIDYRLTDRYIDPPGKNEEHYSERSVYLPDTYWCYRPMMGSAITAAVPAMTTGRITFGCLNNFSKVSPPALQAWIQLLKAVPNSRLLLHAPLGVHRDQTRQRLRDQGIDADRLEFLERISFRDYVHCYEQIDIALDPFPYGGGTTTCDALWMGTPVVTLAGKTAVGRGGVSILSVVGLPELIAEDCDAYVRIAADLAQDLPRLAMLRSSLRQRMLASPLMDVPRFAQGIEGAFRQMWREYCGKQQT